MGQAQPGLTAPVRGVGPAGHNMMPQVKFRVLFDFLLLCQTSFFSQGFVPPPGFPPPPLGFGGPPPPGGFAPPPFGMPGGPGMFNPGAPGMFPPGMPPGGYTKKRKNVSFCC